MNWWEHVPEAVENSVVKDFNIYTDYTIHARRPDIVVIVYTVSLIDISIPADPRVGIKEDEKIEKYDDLQIELWNMKTFVYSNCNCLSWLCVKAV